MVARMADEPAWPLARAAGAFGDWPQTREALHQ